LEAKNQRNVPEIVELLVDLINGAHQLEFGDSVLYQDRLKGDYIKHIVSKGKCKFSCCHYLRSV